MSDSTEKNEVPSVGIPLPQFQAAVDALVALRDSGKFLIFLGRRSRAKLIGDLNDFQMTMADVAEEAVSLEDATRILDEIRKYCSACMDMQDVKGLKQLLIRAVYDDEFTTHKRHKAELEKQLEAKIKLVSEKLVTDAMKQRSKRMQSATIACLEDVDVEIVQHRRENFSSASRSSEEPFLRLRVRHSDGADLSGSIFFPFHMWGPLESTNSNVSSFEIECDESDIDLLIVRLLAAKNSLLKARESLSDGSTN